MTDFDTIWRTQDEIRTVVDSAIGCGIWDIRYNSKREVVELELMTNLVPLFIWVKRSAIEILLYKARIQFLECVENTYPKVWRFSKQTYELILVG